MPVCIFTGREYTSKKQAVVSLMQLCYTWGDTSVKLWFAVDMDQRSFFNKESMAKLAKLSMYIGFSGTFIQKWPALTNIPKSFTFTT